MRIVALLVSACALAACANANLDTSALDTSETDLTLPVGAQRVVAATSERSDITAATWRSEAPAIATVDGSGPSATITGVAAGTATITVQLGAARRTIAVTVTDPVIDRIVITAPTTDVPLGVTLQLTATGHYTDGRMEDITGAVAWKTADPAIATVDAAGQLTGRSHGTTLVAATLGDAGGHLSISIAAAGVVSVAVTPASQALPKGRTLQLTATGTLSDGTMRDVTTLVTWASSDQTHATVVAGLVKAVAVGSATIDATLGSAHASAGIDVGPAVADHVALSLPATIALAQHQRVHVKATVVMSDDTMQDVTATAAWASSAPTVATVAAGQIDTLAVASTATITATASGLSASTTATVGSTACHPVINEVQAGGTTSAADEWVELYNPCTQAIDVTSWTLVYRAAGTTGATDSNALQTLAGSMQPGDLRLYAGTAYAGTVDGTRWGGSTGLLQASSAGIGLRSGPKDTGPLVDSLTYGTVTAGHPFTESTSAPTLANGKSIARGPFDGNDTNTGNVDFTLVATPTPRALNYP